MRIEELKLKSCIVVPVTFTQRYLLVTFPLTNHINNMILGL